MTTLILSVFFSISASAYFEVDGINPNLIPYNYFQLFLGVFIVLTNCLSAMAF